jgi:hypothetical protein
MAVTIDTNNATNGEINIAIKMGTWLAKVKEAGSMMSFNGENIGIIMPIALSRAAIVMDFTLLVCLVIVSHTFP